jgi:hypothetical protein
MTRRAEAGHHNAALTNTRGWDVSSNLLTRFRSLDSDLAKILQTETYCKFKRLWKPQIIAI